MEINLSLFGVHITSSNTSISFYLTSREHAEVKDVNVKNFSKMALDMKYNPAG